MQRIDLTTEYFKGAVSCQQGEGWIQPMRLKADEIPLHHEAFVERALATAGCRLRFKTDTAALALEIEPDDEAARLFDLTTDTQRLATAVVQPGDTQVRFGDLPSGKKILELWFPVNRPVRARTLHIGDDARLEPSPDRRPRWVTYGSSITHCGAAHSPSRTWPATAARLRGLNLMALGYGGNCHMEPLVAMTIRDLPADFISLKVGINMHGGSVSPRTFRTLLIGMVRIIREKHPQTPIAVVSPIVSPPREETPGATGLTLQTMRQELQTAVQRLQQCGDPCIRYYSGLDIFGPELVDDYLPDLLHPNGDGYEVMGRNFADKVYDSVFAQ